MNKKKIIAIGATATSLLLIAGIGVAAWAMTSSNGKVTTPGDDFIGGLTPPAVTKADWGTLTINNAETSKVIFDQNQIVFTSGATENEDLGGYDLPESLTHLSATWALTKAEDTAPNLLDGSVEFYAYIYLENQTTFNSEKLTSYVDFVTSGSGDAWTNVSGAAKQVISGEALNATQESDKVIEGYSCYKYQLAVGTSDNMGVTVPLNSGAPAWVSGKITLTINLDNLLLYKDGKFTEANMNADDEPNNDYIKFQAMLYSLAPKSPVKVVIEAKAKDAAAAKN